jgi:DNA-binding NarL/FixJ family response regulator
MPYVRVALFVESRLYRDGLAIGLAHADSIRVVGKSGTWSDAVSVIHSARPEVVLLDLATAIRARTIRAIRVLAPGSSVIALSVEDVPEEVLPLAEAGVAGYVTREQALGDVVEVIMSVARGEMPCSPRVAASLLGRVATLAGDSHRQRDALLTRREHEIVDLIACGLSNREISKRLTIEMSTVKNHVHNILDKLQVGCRADAVARLRHSMMVTRSDALASDERDVAVSVRPERPD